MEIKGFIQSSLIDWPEKICAVVFLAGCNLRCPFCHNSDLVLHASTLPTITEEEIIAHLIKYKKWLDGVVITGGEPCMHPDLEACIVRLKRNGIAVKLDTNGYFPDILTRLVKEKLIDYVAMDIKTSLDEKKYQKATGSSFSLDAVKESIAFLLRCTVPFEFRTTIVPNLVTKQDLLSIAQTVSSAPRWVWQEFRPIHTLDPFYTTIEPYTEQMLYAWEQEIQAIIPNKKMIVKI